MKIIGTSLSSTSTTYYTFSRTIKLMPLFLLLVSFLLVGNCAAGEPAGGDNKIMLEDFSSSSGHTWNQVNDPVMGGKSIESFQKMIKGEDSIGKFAGHVAIVPFLQAPGFIKAETSTEGEEWPDISSCVGLEVTLQSYTEYNGLRLSFGKNHPDDAMPYTYGYKADLKLPSESSGSIVSVIQIPFTNFTNKWDASTGNAVITCQENKELCPDHETLSQNLYSIAIWGEGVEGDIELDLYSIQAYGCGSSSTITSTNNESNNDKEIIIDEYETLIEDIVDPLEEEGKKKSNTKHKNNKMIILVGIIIAAFYIGTIVQSKAFTKDPRRIISVMDYDTLGDKEMQLV